jgi:hypothetical protein
MGIDRIHKQKNFKKVLGTPSTFSQKFKTPELVTSTSMSMSMSIGIGIGISISISISIIRNQSLSPTPFL